MLFWDCVLPPVLFVTQVDTSQRRLWNQSFGFSDAIERACAVLRREDVIIPSGRLRKEGSSNSLHF